MKSVGGVDFLDISSPPFPLSSTALSLSSALLSVALSFFSSSLQLFSPLVDISSPPFARTPVLTKFCLSSIALSLLGVENSPESSWVRARNVSPLPGCEGATLNLHLLLAWVVHDFNSIFGFSITAVSYTHLTLPTNREV